MLDWLFGKKRKGVKDFGFLHTDMHAHWLPGIDDGAESLDDSLDMIREMAALGYRRLVATPHVMTDLYNNAPETIRGALEQVRRAAEVAGLDIQLDAAAEYLLDEGFPDRLREDRLLTLPGNYLLVEFSFVSPPSNHDAIFFDIQTKGYRPVLAHPERYRYFHARFADYRGLVERGIRLQVNLLSLAGYYGKDVKQVAEQLLAEGLVSLVGTDAHHTRHLDSIREMLGNHRYAKYLNSPSLRNQEWFGSK